MQRIQKGVFATTLVAGLLLASSDALAPLQVTEEQVRTAALKRLLQGMNNEPNLQFFAAHPARKLFVTLTPEQRTAAATAVAGIVKSLLLAPETLAAWNAEVANRGGVDHGLKPNAAGASTDMNQVLDQAKRSVLEGRLRDAQDFAKRKEPMPKETLVMLVQLDLDLVGEPDSMMVASPQAQKAAVAKLKEAQKLTATDKAADLAAAAKALSEAKFLAVGITPNEAGLAEASRRLADGKDMENKRREQELFNKMQFTPQLRKYLQALVTTAATVDFAAATQKKGTKVVFVNPAYEGKSYDWKLLYRAGRGPTQAAVAAAKQVLAALPR